MEHACRNDTAVVTSQAYQKSMRQGVAASDTNVHAYMLEQCKTFLDSTSVHILVWQIESVASACVVMPHDKI